MDFVFTYSGIRVKDMDASVKFYTKVLGMSLFNRTKIPETKGEIAALKSRGSNQILELNSYEEGSNAAGRYKEGSELDHLAFRVSDLGKALKKLGALGHNVVYGPVVGREARWAYVLDPNGIWLEIFDENARKGLFGIENL